MLKNKNKGFILMEAIVVIVVISVALLTLFASYNKILVKVKASNRYDLSEYMYKTYYIREYMKNNCSIDSNNRIYNIGLATSSAKPKEISGNTYECDDKSLKDVFSIFGIKKIYLLKNVGGTRTTYNLKKFDAYMIDYIRQLDVDSNETLIVVEYEKKVKDSNYDDVRTYSDTATDRKELKETYIASLEW